MQASYKIWHFSEVWLFLITYFKVYLWVSSECVCLIKLWPVFSSKIQISGEHGFTPSLPKSVMSMGSCKGMSGTGTLVFPTRTFAGLRWCRSFLSSVCLKCEAIWVFRWPDVLNFLSQWGQAKGLTPAKD